MTFQELNMNNQLLNAITKSGYLEPTAIQAQAIPHILAGKDMLGSAQTGTGKTAAFALPIIQRIQESPIKHGKKQPKALILAPTRELALQIKESFTLYARFSQLRVVAIYGGVPKRNQIQNLKRGVDVIIATPGRLLDLMMMKIIDLSTIEYYVLDEADRMLDMGFIHDVKSISESITSTHQTMLFSATLPPSILNLSKSLLNQPVRVEIAKDNTPLETINQKIYYLDKANKSALIQSILKDPAVYSALVFVRTKQGANRLMKSLNDAGVECGAIHGNKTQAQRQSTLNLFKQHKIRVLVATDVASRGIDIDALSHVINYDLPETPDTYLHRIGRTARAGKLGTSISLCSPEERHLVKSIQAHINMVIPIESDHPFKQKKPVFKPSFAPQENKKKSRNRQKNNTRSRDYQFTAKKKKPYKQYASA